MRKSAIFICTFNRPDDQKTLALLRSLNCKMKIYLVLDDTDKSRDRYIKNYPDTDILIFDKNHYINTCDTGSNSPRYSCVLYARAAVEDMANKLGLDTFIMADDDIHTFRFRYLDGQVIRSQKLKDINGVIDSCMDYMVNSDISSLGFSFTQMFFGGPKVFDEFGRNRIVYNFMFRNTKHKVNWVSWYGEDIITALNHQQWGQYWIAIPDIQQDIDSVASGKSDGGMADVYRNKDGFHLAMCDFIYQPTATKPYWYRNKFMASIVRSYAFPMLISDNYRKEK